MHTFHRIRSSLTFKVFVGNDVFTVIYHHSNVTMMYTGRKILAFEAHLHGSNALYSINYANIVCAYVSICLSLCEGFSLFFLYIYRSFSVARRVRLYVCVANTQRMRLKTAMSVNAFLVQKWQENSKQQGTNILQHTKRLVVDFFVLFSYFFIFLFFFLLFH